MYKYKTHAEFGPLGEVPVTVEYDYTPNADSESAGSVEVYGCAIYYNGKEYEFDAEAALNIRGPGGDWMDEVVREWHEENVLPDEEQSAREEAQARLMGWEL